MASDKKIEELKNAHAQGFFSDADFERRLAGLGENHVDAEEIAAQSGFGEEAKAIAKNVLRSEMATDMAAHAAGGAVIASVVPFIGTATGALVGAAIGAAKNFVKK